MYQIYVDELYGGLQRPNEDEKKKYAPPSSQTNECSVLVYRVGWFSVCDTFSSLSRLAEKKATIGYTYEDSTVTEPDGQSEKGEEDDSENSESEEDEGIPDIGEETFAWGG